MAKTTKQVKSTAPVATEPVNTVQLKGRLSKDPYIIGGQQKTSLAVFSVAIEMEKGDGKGGSIKQPHFMDCSFQLSDTKPEWLKKGQAVLLKGHLFTFRPKVKAGEIHKNAAGQDLIPFPKMVIRVDQIEPTVMATSPA